MKSVGLRGSVVHTFADFRDDLFVSIISLGGPGGTAVFDDHMAPAPRAGPAQPRRAALLVAAIGLADLRWLRRRARRAEEALTAFALAGM